MRRTVEREVVVVGGGPGGAAVAISLARRGVSVVVLTADIRPKLGECLPPAARPLLAELGLPTDLAKDGHLPCWGSRSVWGGPVPVERPFVIGPYGPGWLLDRVRFDAVLSAAARAAGADWRPDHRVRRIERGEVGWKLTTESAAGTRVWRAAVVVDATGRPARVARALGVRRLPLDRLVGVAGVWRATPGRCTCDGWTLVEAGPGGWWYSARQPGEQMVVAYFTDADLLRQSGEGPGETFYKALAETRTTVGRLRDGGYESRTALAVAPANTARLEAFAGTDWLAVGDAAVAYDPLSSYGVTAALGTGLHAADAIQGLIAGRLQTMTDYSQLQERAFSAIWAQQTDLYAAERRWTDKRFWRRRHSAPKV